MPSTLTRATEPGEPNNWTPVLSRPRPRPSPLPQSTIHTAQRYGMEARGCSTERSFTCTHTGLAYTLRKDMAWRRAAARLKGRLHARTLGSRPNLGQCRPTSDSLENQAHSRSPQQRTRSRLAAQGLAAGRLHKGRAAGRLNKRTRGRSPQQRTRGRSPTQRTLAATAAAAAAGSARGAASRPPRPAAAPRPLPASGPLWRSAQTGLTRRQSQARLDAVGDIRAQDELLESKRWTAAIRAPLGTAVA